MDSKTKRRNVWTSVEVRHFLSLIKEKKVLGLMDGKRLRVSDIFKTLVGPMKEQGFARDPSQMIVKYKNLKAEYYKCKRHNSISGNSPMSFDFFTEMDDLLGQRPMSQVDAVGSAGFESLPNEGNEENQENRNLDEDLVIEVEETPIELSWELYDDAPDTDGAIPGGSKEPGIKKAPVKSNVKTQKKKKEDPALSFLREVEEKRKTEVEEDKQSLKDLLTSQKTIMMDCTRFFLKGLKKILTQEKENKESESDSDSNSV